MSKQNGAASVVNGSLEKTGILTPYDGLEPLKQTAEVGAPQWEQSSFMAQAYFNEMVELRRLNSQLQAHNRELESFAHTVAHQLKSSSSLVFMFGNVLKESLKVPKAMRPFLDGIIQSSYKVNYLDNAIRYGGEPPRIELGATLQADKYVRFWIHDNGPGLSPEKQAHIFKPFIRLDQIKLEGYGLGLSIVQDIVKKLNGQVGVESQNIPGQGSTFMFTLSAQQS